ncbi:MAG: Ig-like domain-containing protein [bacterium]|nr:Ig-like domain-containing protein [bacterium]
MNTPPVSLKNKVYRIFKQSFFIIFAAAFLMGGFFVADSALATGGTVSVIAQNSQVNVSADAVSGSSVSVGTITMTEGNNGAFQLGTITLTPPTGFIFDITSIVDIEIIGDSSFANNINNAVSGTHFSASTVASLISFNIIAPSANNKAGTLVWSNIKVKPTSGSPLVSGRITIGGTSVASPNAYNNVFPILLNEVAGYPSVSNSTFVCNPTVQAAGGISTCNITVRDQFNNSISSASVLLSSTGSGNNFSTNPALTDANGNTTITLGSGTAETKIVTATIDGSVILPTQLIIFYVSTPTQAHIVAIPNTQEASLSGSSVNLTISITDQHGNPANDGIVVNVSGIPSTLGTVTVTGSGNTASGQVTRVLTFNNKGDITLTVNISSIGNLALTGDSIVHFVDTIKPVITIILPNPAEVEYRGTYSDAGATAFDNIDGNITSSIMAINLVNPNTINVVPNSITKIVGVYTVTYNVSDSVPNAADPAVRTVNVLDRIAPIITSITSDATAEGALKIGNTITFTLTPTPAEPVATVSGSYNGHSLTWSTVNSGVTYTATYTVIEGDTDRISPWQITGVIMTDEAGNISVSANGTDVVKTIDANTPSIPSVLVAAGPYINAAEELAGFTTMVSYNTTLSNGAKAGDTLELWLNGAPFMIAKTVVLSASDITAGSYSFTIITDELGADGVKLLTARLTDVAGNVGLWSASLVLTLDTGIPSVPSAPDLDAASDLGLSDTDNITNDNTPSFNGTAEAGSTVKLYDGATEIGNGTATGGGAWSIISTLLVDGAHTITATATDAAGNTSGASESLSVTIDTELVALSLTSTAPNPTKASPILITAQFTQDVNGFEVGDIVVTNGAVGTFVKVNASTYQFDVIPAGQGAVTVNIAAGVAHDTAGNGNTVATGLSRIYDTINPTVTLVALSDLDALVKQGDTLIITATFSEDMALSPVPTIELTGTNTVAPVAMTRTSATNYTYSHTVGAGDGLVTIIIAGGTDLATNTLIINSATTFTVDNTLPVIASSDPINTVANAIGGATVFYTTPIATDLYPVNPVVTCLPASGAFFVLGNTIVTCNATDQAGNIAIPMTFNVMVNPDTVTHIILIASPTSLAFSQTSLITITGKDQYDNTVTNNDSTVIVLSADGGGSLGDTILTLSEGVATTNLSKDSVGIVHVTASSVGLSPQAVTVTFTKTDTSSPYVESHTPVNGATGVALNIHPVLIFSEPLDTTTVSSANIQLRKYSDNSVILANVSPAEGDRQVIITPASSLDFSTSYYLAVSAGVTDKVGNPAVVLDNSTKGNHMFTTLVDNTVLAVTYISAVANAHGSTGFAIANNTFEDGWAWIFYITVPTNETAFAMKFADWTSVLPNTIPVANNVRYSSVQASNGPFEITEANELGGYLNLTGDLFPGIAGRQIEILVEAKIPLLSAGGSYSTSYGIQTNPAIAQATDAENVAAAQAAVTALAQPWSPIYNNNRNIITDLQAIVDAVSTGVTVTIKTTNNSQISIDGAIAYPGVAVTGNVIFTLTKGTEIVDQTISVIIYPLG